MKRITCKEKQYRHNVENRVLEKHSSRSRKELSLRKEKGTEKKGHIQSVRRSDIKRLTTLLSTKQESNRKMLSFVCNQSKEVDYSVKINHFHGRKSFSGIFLRRDRCCKRSITISEG